MEAEPPLTAGRVESRSVGLLGGLALYINLERRQDRRKCMEALVAPHSWLGANLRRVQAMDGKDLSWPALVGERLLAPEAELEALRAAQESRPTCGDNVGQRSCHLTLGACGCALSHRAAWKVLVESDADWALVLEDDISAVCSRFDDELRAVMRMLPSNWDICYLGFHGGSLLPEGKNFTGPLIHLSSDDGWVPGLYGYLMRKAFARSLLAQTFPLVAQLDAVVGAFAAGFGRGHAVPPEQFLVFSLPTEESRDTDVQTFHGDML